MPKWANKGLMEHLKKYWLFYIAGLIILFWYFYKNKTMFRNGGVIENKDFKKDSIKTLVRQASRWAVASIQDRNDLISVLHANYGAGYLWALRDIATDTEIEDATGIDILKFRDEIIKAQDDANRRMIKTCPSFSQETSYLTNLAAE